MPSSRSTESDLSGAEQRVVAQVREGRSNAEIAIRLGISVDSVEALLTSALVGLGLDSRAQLRAATTEPGERRRGWPRRSRRALVLGPLLALAAALPFLLSSGDDAGSVSTEDEAATVVAELVAGLTNRSMTEMPRALHTATPLANGSVLLEGDRPGQRTKADERGDL